MKKLITLAMLFIVFYSYGQTYQTLNKILVPEGRIMTKKTTVKNCVETVNNAQIVELKKTFKNTSAEPEQSITVTEKKNTGDTFVYDKPIELKINSFKGKANIYVDETDKSKVHINYWLNGEWTVDKNLTVVKIERTLQCDGITYTEAIKTTTTLDKNTDYPYWRCETTEINEDYFKNSDVRFEIKDNAGNILYYLINKYDGKADYTIELKNREKISYTNTAIEFGPITIPIKYRFGFGTDTKEVKEEFTTDLNLGIFAGYRFGKFRARYERGVGFKELAHLSCTIGGFLSASTTTLSKTNTNAGNTPITTDSTQSIGTISPGVGVMGNMYGFNLGIFLGCDIGVGQESENWNYNGKPWLGIGIGYSLTNFWKK